MAEPNFAIINQHPVNDPNAPMMRDMVNEGIGHLDPMLIRPTQYLVYLYTVSRREFTIYRPPLIHSLIITACPTGERYRLVRGLPHPFAQPDINPSNGEPIIYYHDARFVAQDICNPDNLSLDQDSYLKASGDRALGSGVNLSEQGVFWSLNNPPKEEEIAAAEKRRDIYYKRLIDQANSLAASDPKALHDILNQDYHLAAEHFGLDTSWHQVLKPMAECPNCGDKIKPGVAFHNSSVTGMLCIIDRERAKAAGVRVPENSPITETEFAPVKRGPGRPRKTELQGEPGS